MWRQKIPRTQRRPPNTAALEEDGFTTMHAIERMTGSPRWRRVAHYVPILGWLPDYQRAWLPADLVAGMTLWGVGVPSALAYAQMAGMPPVWTKTTISPGLKRPSRICAIMPAAHLPV